MACTKDATDRPVIRGAQYCPACGLPAERDDVRLNRMGVALGNLLCAQGHGWSIHWVVTA